MPFAMPPRRRSASSRNVDTWAAMTRRAVGTVWRHQWKASWTSASGRRDSVTNIAT